MKSIDASLPVALLATLLLAGPALAQDEKRARTEANLRPTADADRSHQEMKEAEEQLADAARRVAELSARTARSNSATSVISQCPKSPTSHVLA